MKNIKMQTADMIYQEEIKVSKLKKFKSLQAYIQFWRNFYKTNFRHLQIASYIQYKR
jgi:hypothetical protein